MTEAPMPEPDPAALDSRVVGDGRTGSEEDVTLLISPDVAEGLAAALARRANSIKRQTEPGGS